jgi:hypothetical protein
VLVLRLVTLNTATLTITGLVYGKPKLIPTEVDYAEFIVQLQDALRRTVHNSLAESGNKPGRK